MGMEHEIANLSIDKQRNTDLMKLTTMGGPFTTLEQVEDLMARADIDDKKKELRLYLQGPAKVLSYAYDKTHLVAALFVSTAIYCGPGCADVLKSKCPRDMRQ